MTSSTDQTSPRYPGSATTLAEHWNELASAALLGVERRPIPPTPMGEVESLLDRLDTPDPAERVLIQVAALSAARRAGLRPNPPAERVAPVGPDRRPICPPAVASRLAAVLAEWPDLLEEWLDRVTTAGWRLPPDSAVVLLTRLRGNPPLRAKTVSLCGPLAEWLADLFPAQFGATRVTAPSASGQPQQPPKAQELPIPPDIAQLLTITEPRAFVAEVARRLDGGALANHNRPSLMLLIRQLDPSFLRPLAAVLERAGTNPRTLGLALSLGDLTRFRLTMIEEFPQ